MHANYDQIQAQMKFGETNYGDFVTWHDHELIV